MQCAGLLKWELAHLVTKIGTNLLSELSELDYMTMCSNSNNNNQEICTHTYTRAY